MIKMQIVSFMFFLIVSYHHHICCDELLVESVQVLPAYEILYTPWKFHFQTQPSPSSHTVYTYDAHKCRRRYVSVSSFFVPSVL